MNSPATARRVTPGAARRWILPLSSLFLALACGQADPSAPPVPGDGTDPSAPPAPSSTTDPSPGGSGGLPPTGVAPNDAASYFPHLDGSSWTYRHADLTGSTWEEVVTVEAIDFGGRPAFLMADNENPTGERGDTVHVVEGGRVLRIHQDVVQNGATAFSVDYDPGFLRWDDAWATGTGGSWSYTRTETDPLGVQTAAVRNFTFTVLSTSVSVTVDAGTFECTQVERIRADSGETKQYWFAAGVGKIREVNVTTGGVEELVAYALP